MPARGLLTPGKLLMLFVTAFLVILIGAAILIIAALSSDAQASFGAIIFIGPFPLAIGIGPEATWMLLLTSIFAILTVVMFFLFLKGLRS